MNLKLTPFDTADYLDCTEARIEYLRGALEEGDKEYMAIALTNIAQSLGLGATIYVKSSTIGQCCKCGKNRPLFPHSFMENGNFCDTFWCYNCIQKTKQN